MKTDMRKNVKKIDKVNEKIMIVGIDIGKNANTSSWRCTSGFSGKFSACSNDMDGFDRLWEKIVKVRDLQKVERVIVGFESTGIYWEPLVHYLRKKPVDLVQVNPMHTKRFKEVEDNSKEKSDEKDPRVIIKLVEVDSYLSVIVPTGPAAQLRRLIHGRERVMQNINVSKNQLHDLVFLIFPEFLKVMKGLRSKTSLYLLEHYPTPQDIIALGFENLVLLLKKVSRGQMNYTRALKLWEAAKHSGGIDEGIASILTNIDYILKEIALYTTFVEDIERNIAIYLKKVSYSTYLMSVKGIGEIIAATIIGEVGDFRAIYNEASLLKLAGLNLTRNSSGKYKGEIHISKMGRALLRKNLFLAAVNVVRKGGIMHEYYQQQLKKGKKSKSVLIAVSRKLLKVSFALVRKNMYYTYQNTTKLAA